MPALTKREQQSRVYGREHTDLRARYKPMVLAGGVKCARCHELIRPGEAWDLGHVPGDPSRYVGPEHARCNRATSVQWKAPPPEPEPERDGLAHDDPRWRVPWLSSLLAVPADAVWPRLMTVPHPRAVGSLGGRVRGVRREAEQRPVALVAEAGRYSAARGRPGGRARLGDGGLDDGPPARQVVAAQGVAAVADPSGREVRGAAGCDAHRQGRRGHARRFSGRRGRGRRPGRTITRSGRSTARRRSSTCRTAPVGCSGRRKLCTAIQVSCAAADEAWKVKSSSIEEGLTPTMVERAQPQLLLVSTAHRLTTELMLERRRVALAGSGGRRRRSADRVVAPRMTPSSPTSRRGGSRSRIGRRNGSG